MGSIFHADSPRRKWRRACPRSAMRAASRNTSGANILLLQVRRIALVPCHLRHAKSGHSLTRKQCRTMPDRAVIDDHAPSLELPDAVATLDMIKITAADNDLINIAIDIRKVVETEQP